MPWMPGAAAPVLVAVAVAANTGPLVMVLSRRVSPVPVFVPLMSTGPPSAAPATPDEPATSAAAPAAPAMPAIRSWRRLRLFSVVGSDSISVSLIAIPLPLENALKVAPSLELLGVSFRAGALPHADVRI